MRYLLLMICSIVILCQLMAEEENSIETSTLFFELGEITVPLSFYTDSWDPKEKLPIFSPGGRRVEEKDLIVSIDNIPRELKNGSARDYESNWNKRR